MIFRSRGLTLVELMISLALASVLCLGISTMLVFAQRAYLQDEEMARLQDSGRYALQLLRRELAMAGFMGRMHPEELAREAPGGTPCYEYLLVPDHGLEHFDNVGVDGLSDSASDVPAACRRPGQYQPGSDVIIVRRTQDAPARDFGEPLGSLTDVTLYLQASLGNGVILSGADVSSDAVAVWQYAPTQFLVRNYARHPGDGIPSLCRQRLSPNRADVAPLECLVEGVEMLQVEYGLDTNGDGLADIYRPDPVGTDLDEIVIARMSLLMRSHREFSGYRDDRSYEVGQVRYQAPGDGYYRQLMSGTVLVRNSNVFRG